MIYLPWIITNEEDNFKKSKNILKVKLFVSIRIFKASQNVKKSKGRNLIFAFGKKM